MILWGLASGLLLLEQFKLAAWHAAGPAPVIYDAAGYWALGTQVAQGDLWMVADPVGYRTPGYPWFLGALQRVYGAEAWRAASLLQHSAVWLTSLLTALWVFSLSRSGWLTCAALVLRGGSLAAASFAGSLLTESLYGPILVGTLWALTWAMTGRAWLGRWWLVGCLLGVGALLRPAHLGLVPVILVGVWIAESPPTWRERLRGCARRLAVAGGVALLICGPWIGRNMAVFGRPQLVIFLGRELWISVYGVGRPAAPPLPETERGRALRASVERVAPEVNWANNWEVSRALRRTGLDDAATDDAMRAVAWEGLVAEPARFAMRVGWRAVDFWRSVYDREPQLYGDRFDPGSAPRGQNVWGSAEARRRRAVWLDRGGENWLLVVEVGSLLGLLGACGLWLHPGTWRIGVVLLTALLSVGLLTALLDLPAYRYRMVLEPVLIVAGILGSAAWSRLIRAGRLALRRSIDT